MTDAGASAVVASAAAAVLHSMGLDPYILVVATVGAVFLQAWQDTSAGRLRAMAQVVLSGLIGALMAQGAADYAALHSRATEMAMAAFCGFAAFRIFAALAKRSDGIVDKFISRGGPKQ